MEILAKCPQCNGTGRVRKKLPFAANPKARGTRADRLGWETCSQCKGTGRIGIK